MTVSMQPIVVESRAPLVTMLTQTAGTYAGVTWFIRRPVSVSAGTALLSTQTTSHVIGLNGINFTHNASQSETADPHATEITDY